MALSLTANGTLTVTVEDDLGNQITAGALQLSNQAGGTRYSTEETIVNGLATFDNVPYDGTGIDFYMAQNGSDSNHDPLAVPQAVDMRQLTQAETVLNSRKTVTPSFTMADALYGRYYARNR